MHTWNYQCRKRYLFFEEVGADGLGAVFVVVVIPGKYIWKEEEPEDDKEDEQFYKNYGP